MTSNTAAALDAARRLCAHVAEVHGAIRYVEARELDGVQLGPTYDPSGVMVESKYLADLALALEGVILEATAEAVLAAFAAERKACRDFLNSTDAPNAALLEWDARRETYAQLMAAYVTANHTTIRKAERALGIGFTR